jgi:hypothetical protein
MTAPRCDLARRHARHRTQREGSGEGSSKEKHDENVELETWDSQRISAKLEPELEHDMHYGPGAIRVHNRTITVVHGAPWPEYL